jgi:AcrR family transcriptional regulator
MNFIDNRPIFSLYYTQGNILTSGHKQSGNMGIIERREREKAERKELIMRYAKELILEKGAEKVSIMDIAKRAELSKATLYLYFPSKDLLFKEICDTAADKFIAHFRSKYRPGMSAIDTLRLIWGSYLELFGESYDILIIFNMKQYLAPEFPLISIDEDARSPAGSNYAFYTLLMDVLTRGISEGVFAADVNPDGVCRLFLSLFSYFFESALKQPKTERNSLLVHEEMGSLFQIILRGIAGEGQDRSLFDLPNLRKENGK